MFRNQAGEGTPAGGRFPPEAVVGPAFMPCPYPHFCPVGTCDNSPAVHCWGRETSRFRATSPVGTAEIGRQGFNRPYGTETELRYALLPSDKSLGYCQTTLRVEMLAVFEEHRSKDVGKDKA